MARFSINLENRTITLHQLIQSVLGLIQNAIKARKLQRGGFENCQKPQLAAIRTRDSYHNCRKILAGFILAARFPIA